MVEKVAAVHAGLVDAVTSRLALHDPEGFQRVVDPVAFKDAAHRALKGDATAFDRLGQSYRETLDKTDPEALTAALTRSGVRHRKGPGGGLVADVPRHGEMAFRTAVRLGLFRFSLAKG